MTVVRGEVFARLLFTNRPVTADRTRVKYFDCLAIGKVLPIPQRLSG
jgi:hypothetical protein